MPFWTLYGIRKGTATTGWPAANEENGQRGVLGFPRYIREKCTDGCTACSDVCLPGAIQIQEQPPAPASLAIDYGKCIVCQLCTEACPTDAMQKSEDWAFGVGHREDLVWAQALASSAGRELEKRIERLFQRSLNIRHVDAGSCNGCESELQALNNPFYNLHRLGIFFTPSPRFADLLLVTGPVTYAMRDALLATHDAMPKPCWVMATGTCAVSGGAVRGGYACGSGIADFLPVDIYLPGCPPNPAAIIQALLLLLNRDEQRIRGGQVVR